MSFFDSISSLFGITNKKTTGNSPEKPVAAAERLTSPSNGYVRYESGEGLTVPYDQPHSARINNTSLSSNLRPNTTPTFTRSSVARQTTQLKISESSKLKTPAIPTPTSTHRLVKKTTESPNSKPFFTSYSTPFNTSQTESNKPIALPKPKTKFTTPSVKPVIPSTSSSTLKTTASQSSTKKSLVTSSSKPAILPKHRMENGSAQKVTPSTSVFSHTVIINETAPQSTIRNFTSPSFNTSQIEIQKSNPLPKPFFLTQRKNSVTSSPSIPPRTQKTAESQTSLTKPILSSASNSLNNEPNIHLQNVKTTSFPVVKSASNVSNNLPLKFDLNNEHSANSIITKSTESRQSKRKILIDTSVSKTLSNTNVLTPTSGLNLISKKISPSKIQPIDTAATHISKPLLASNLKTKQPQQKPATVSKIFTNNSFASTELQSLTSNPVATADKKKKKKKNKPVLPSTTDSEASQITVIKPLNEKKPGDSKQEIPQISNKQKKKKAWNEKKRLNKLNKNGKTFYNKNGHQKNSKISFALPEETLSIENYYKSFNLTYKDGVYLDPNGEENEFLMGCLIFDENEEMNDGSPLKSDKVFPKIYCNLLNAARGNKKVLSNELLHRPPNNVEILPKLQKKIVTVEDAGKKFEVFNYLQLIEEFLESDEPLAKGATVTVEEGKSKAYQKMINAELQNRQKSEKNVVASVSKNVLIVTVPFEKDSYIEEKITFMGDIYLFPDTDVENNQNSNFLKVKVAKVLPSVKNGPTTLITILGNKEFKELPVFGDLKRKTFSIFVVPNVVAANAIMKSIKTVTKNLDLTEKVFPSYKAKPIEIQTFNKQMLSGLDSLFYNSEKSFNQKQKEAIYAMTRPVNTTFMLFGPPGTGKTYTLVETIRQLLNPNSRKIATTDRTILICTPSNMAADAIAEGIVNRNFLHPDDVFRVVSASRDTFKRNEKLDCITKRKVITDRNEEQICTVYELPHKDLIQEYKIIICTLGSIPRLSNCVEPGHFSHIFVDEAAQAPEMDVWLAVGLLATKNTRIILAGDPKQLGPVTTVDILSTNDKYGYKKSLLARLVDKNIFKNDPRYLIQLTDNHRSHEGIVKISSELFYENSLVPTKPAGHDSLCCLPFLRKSNFPILFHSVTSGMEETSAETRSKRNLAEVSVIVEYVKKCLHQKVAAKDIGVVSPYKYQAESIRQRLNNKEITVETVEKYQGSERRVIIISTVRTSGNLGFMADDLRFNTAITRAKHLLIVVGNNNSLSLKQKSWKRFIDYCGQNGSLVKDFRDNHESIQHSLAHLRI